MDDFTFFLTDNGNNQGEYWGYCSDECQGEIPHPGSQYNLANNNNSVFNEVFSGGLYDLRQFEAGYCVTYDPPARSEGGITNGLYFFLGQRSYIETILENFLLYQFKIYLHDKVTRTPLV